MTDEERIRLLRWAFEDDGRHPPAPSIAALRGAVRNTFDRRRRRRSRKLGSFVAAGVATTALTGSSVAFAVDGIPPSMRAVMHGMGLPVDSIGLANAKSIEANLSQALREHNLLVAKRDAHRLRHQLRTLNSDDRARVEQQAIDLLTRTHSLVHPGGRPRGASTTAGTPGQTDLGDHSRSSVTTVPASPAHPVSEQEVPVEGTAGAQTALGYPKKLPIISQSEDPSEEAPDRVSIQQSPATTVPGAGPNTDTPSGSLRTGSHNPTAGTDD
jgi:hypothetical protein